MNVNPINAENVLNKMLAMEEFVARAYLLYGEYDLIAKVKSSNMAHLNQLVNKIKSFEGVKSVRTLVVADQTREQDKLADRKNILSAKEL